MGRWIIALDMVMAVRQSESEVVRVAKGDIHSKQVPVCFAAGLNDDDRPLDHRRHVTIKTLPRRRFTNLMAL